MNLKEILMFAAMNRGQKITASVVIQSAVVVLLLNLGVVLIGAIRRELIWVVLGGPGVIISIIILIIAIIINIHKNSPPRW